MDSMRDSSNNQAEEEESTIERYFRLWSRIFYFGLAAFLIVYAIGWWLARPGQPESFYGIAIPSAQQPGRLLRVEAFERDVPAGASGWRILYTTTGMSGEIRVASALVIAANVESVGPRPVIAWAHGTTGIDRGCAPSMLRRPFAWAPAFERALTEGWIWVATDYTGLGTIGPHPYLAGRAEAQAVLDAVRAAREMKPVKLADRVVTWGHSQGGHAALWTGMLAPDYAPDIDLAGIAAVAPATDLPALVSGVHRSFMGRILSAYLVQAYAAIYPDVDSGGMLRGFASPLARDISGRCLAEFEILVSALPSLLASPTLFKRAPPQGAFADRLAENVPNGSIAAPVLIAQGGRDSVVLPGVQGGFVANRCLAGQAIDYHGFPEEGHLSIVAEDGPVSELLLQWTRARLKGETAPQRCRVIKY